MSNSLWSHGLQHTRLPYPPQSLRICSNSCPLSQWCYLTISSSAAPFSFCLHLSQHQGLFQGVSSSHQVAKILELQHHFFQWVLRVDFLLDWLIRYPCSRKDFQESSPEPQIHHKESVSSFVLSLLYDPTLTSVLDYWKNHSFNYMDLCQQSDISAF